MWKRWQYITLSGTINYAVADAVSLKSSLATISGFNEPKDAAGAIRLVRDKYLCYLFRWCSCWSTHRERETDRLTGTQREFIVLVPTLTT